MTRTDNVVYINPQYQGACIQSLAHNQVREVGSIIDLELVLDFYVTRGTKPVVNDLAHIK